MVEKRGKQFGESTFMKSKLLSITVEKSACQDESNSHHKIASNTHNIFMQFKDKDFILFVSHKNLNMNQWAENVQDVKFLPDIHALMQFCDMCCQLFSYCDG